MVADGDAVTRVLLIEALERWGAAGGGSAAATRRPRLNALVRPSGPNTRELCLWQEQDDTDDEGDEGDEGDGDVVSGALSPLARRRSSVSRQPSIPSGAERGAARQTSRMLCVLQLAGVGLSLIDEEPREVLLTTK